MNLVTIGARTALAALIALPAVSASAATLGSARALTSAPRFVSIPPSTKLVDFAIHLPLRNRATLEKLVEAQSDPGSPIYRHWLNRAQFRASFGPSPASIARVSAYLRSQGFSVNKVETQLIHVSGTVANVQRTFAVHMGNVRLREGRTTRTILATREQLLVPAAIKQENATVTGLGYRVLPQPDSNLVKPAPLNRYSTAGPYWFDDLKQAYDYPAYPTLTGAGMTIATVGYSDFSDSDAKLYFNHEGMGSGSGFLAPAPKPQHIIFPNSLAFSTNSGASDEANLDVQMAAGSAPGATVIGVAAPATSGEGFLYVYSYLVENNIPDIVTTSYGECELFYTAAYNGGQDYTDILQSYHDMFMQGNSEGITFLFSSGDDSGRQCPQAGYILNPGAGASYIDVAGTSIWSDDPNVTSVGGTNLETKPNPSVTAAPVGTSVYSSEEADSDKIVDPIDPLGTGNLITNARWGSGGGASTIFAAPAYQSYVNTGSSMRVDPDISMHMGGCPLYTNPLTGNPAAENCSHEDSADVAAIGGEFFLLIGTSASSPELAGMIALYEQQIGGQRVGNLNVPLYKDATKLWASGGLRGGLPYGNGVVGAPRGAPAYNPVTGLGTPDVRVLMGLENGLAAGNPQTSSNP